MKAGRSVATPRPSHQSFIPSEGIEVSVMALIIDLVICFSSRGSCTCSRAKVSGARRLMFFNVLFSAMIAFNFYEPVAKLIDSTGIPWGFSDTLCMLGLFCISVGDVANDDRDDRPGHGAVPHADLSSRPVRFRCGGAVVTIAIVILAFHAAPVDKKIFTPSSTTRKPPFGMGLDHQWLGFFQYETGAVFTSLGAGQPDPFGTYGRADGERMPVNVFDPCAQVADRPPGRTAVRR